MRYLFQILATPLHSHLLLHLKMGKKILTFGDIKIEKHIFYRYKSPYFFEDADVENVLVSNTISSGEKDYKNFIAYLCEDYKVKSLHITLKTKT